MTRQEGFSALGDCERVGRRTSTNEHLDRLERVHKAQRQHDRRPARRVVAGPPGEHRERPDDCVGLVVVDDGLGVGEDVEVSVGKEVHIRVPVVGLPIAPRRLCVKKELHGCNFEPFRGEELDVWDGAPPDHDDALVGEELGGGVPPVDLGSLRRFHPVARAGGRAGCECPER